MHEPRAEIGDGIAARNFGPGPQTGFGRISPSQASAELEFIGFSSRPALHTDAGEYGGQAAGHEGIYQDPPFRGGEGRTSRYHRMCSEILPVMISSGAPVIRTARILLRLGQGAGPMRYHVSCGRICVTYPALTWKGTTSQPANFDIPTWDRSSPLIDRIPMKSGRENAAWSMNTPRMSLWTSASRLAATRSLRPYDDLVSTDLSEGWQNPYPAA